jgi:prepilin-type N-terminal cleavage/methylation domain-containing protein
MTMDQDRVKSAGFTLLELVLAVSLTSLLTLVVYTALNLSLKAVQRGRMDIDKLQEVRVGQSILERSLSSAILGSMDNRLYFTGDPAQMRFFTLVPLESYNLGGVYHWRVLVGEDVSGQKVLAVEQTKNVNWFRDPEGVEVRQIIIGNLAEVRFTYGYGAEEYETWDGKRDRTLPDWVRVYLTQQGHQPMVWQIPIHVSEYRIAQRAR